MDTALHSRLGLDAEAARERALAVLERVRLAGGRAALLWHNTYLADDRAPGYGALWGDLLDELARAGRRARPRRGGGAGGAGGLARRAAGAPPDVGPPPTRRAHLPQGGPGGRRGRGAGRGSAPRASRSARARRLAAGWRLAREARRRDADLYHVHDPELLPAALWLAQRSGRPVVYDAHEYLGQTARTKRWLPRALRLPARPGPPSGPSGPPRGGCRPSWPPTRTSRRASPPPAPAP